MPKIEGSASRVYSKALGSPLALSAAGCLALTALTDAEQEITEGITNPDVPRSVSVVANDTQVDDVVIDGTNEKDEVISETLTLNSATPVNGAKAFKTITKITLPIKDTEGVDVSVGYGDKLGLGVLLARDSVVAAHFGGVIESTRPTVAVSATAIESNTVLLNSAMDGSAVVVDYYDS